MHKILNQVSKTTYENFKKQPITGQSQAVNKFTGTKTLSPGLAETWEHLFVFPAAAGISHRARPGRQGGLAAAGSRTMREKMGHAVFQSIYPGLQSASC